MALDGQKNDGKNVFVNGSVAHCRMRQGCWVLGVVTVAQLSRLGWEEYVFKIMIGLGFGPLGAKVFTIVSMFE